MRIKRLDIMGFKSFPERVQIPLSEGISAVVGPNGCGKSNIVDAIRWVMGEQSPRQLRGRQMDDILFNGAKNHQPSGLAEVTMVLANESGPQVGSGLGPSEISITRRLFRSGDSEYLINRVPCRLKDITQFFMDTGMGTKAYAIIEQGRIGAMVDARPEERRTLIDEAAGITRYKAQKKEAERKIESTEQNLVHINTLMAETKRQINSLTRAAQKAATYKELRTELKDLDWSVAAAQFIELDSGQLTLVNQKKETQENLAALLIGLDRMEVDLEAARLSIVDQEKRAEVKAEAFSRLQIEYNKLRQEDDFLTRQSQENHGRRLRLEEDLVRLGEQRQNKTSELTAYREKIESLGKRVRENGAWREERRSEVNSLKQEYEYLTGRRDEVSAELSDIRARSGRLEEMLAGHERLSLSHHQRRDETQAEMEELADEAGLIKREELALDRERQDLEDLVAEARERTAVLKEEQAAFRSEVARLSESERKVDSNLTGLSSRLTTLKDVQAKFGWYPQGVKALLASAGLREAGVLGPLAERLVVPPGFETAMEAALGERINFVVVRDRAAAAAAINFLNDKKLGRVGFVCLADLMVEDENDLSKALIGDYLLEEDLTGALNAPSGSSVLTRAGEFFGAGGLVIGGRAVKNDKGLLQRLREMEELDSQVALLQKEKDHYLSLKEEAAARLAGVGEVLAQTEEKIQAVRAAQVEADKKLSVVRSRRGQIERRLASGARTLENLTELTDRLAREKQDAASEKDTLIEAVASLEEELESVAEEAAVMASRLEEARQREQQASLDISTLSEQLKTAQREAVRTEEWLRDLDSQAAGKEREIDEAESQKERVILRLEQIASELTGFTDRLDQAREEVNRLKQLVDETRSRHNSQENEARQARRRRSELDEKIRKQELDLQEISFKRQALINRLETEYKMELTSRSAGEDREVGQVIEAMLRARKISDLDLEKAKKRQEELRKTIQGMGEVNLTAIGEHDALMERYRFYRDQYEDLNSSIENLKASIHRINRTCKIRFKSTFEAVDQKLREIFPLLFEGGEAWLSLTDAADPLESGVEIHVHPPGKRLTVMSLLSGGEKALVALAMIFSLYLIKPSPFCLLDETDAPLDEANIDRFNRLLKRLGQSSQIIMVTHNKRTMQISQMLYGVTMELPGISKMVSVSLSDLEELEQNGQMVQTG